MRTPLTSAFFSRLSRQAIVATFEHARIHWLQEDRKTFTDVILFS